MSAPDANGWMPINLKKLPKGEFLAAIHVRNAKGNGRWERHVLCLDEDGRIDWDFGNGWDIEDYSHWQPLPKPPVVQS